MFDRPQVYLTHMLLVWTYMGTRRQLSDASYYTGVSNNAIKLIANHVIPQVRECVPTRYPQLKSAGTVSLIMATINLIKRVVRCVGQK